MQGFLQGADETPYSRTANGRAVMRSSVWQFIASEAMAYLGIIPTQALRDARILAGGWQDTVQQDD